MRTYNNERGIALVLALFLMTAMSVLGVSLMFLSQTETYASMNYRMMSQARYAGEAGVQKAANFLLDSTQYLVAIPSDPLLDPSVCNYQVSPVLCNGQPVILSATCVTYVPGCTPTQASNYPVAAVQTAFAAAGQGTLAAGNVSISYESYAKLLAMQVFYSYGGEKDVVQTWEITGVGALVGPRKAAVEVVALVEKPKVVANPYAAFGTDNGCAALNFGGNVHTNSYSPAGLTGSTPPTVANEGGDVGTNGNLTIYGHVDVYGNLYTPRTGVGACTTGNVTALTESGQATVSGSAVQLPKPLVYPTPTIPSYSTLSAVSLSSPGTSATTCALLGLTPGTSAEVSAGTKQCNVNSGTDTITINGNGSELSLPSLTLTAHINVVLVAAGPSPAKYDFNSIMLAGGSTVGVSATSSSQSVVVNVVGKDNGGTNIATPLDFTGGTFTGVTGCASCSVYDASMLQFIYGGSGNMIMTGNSTAAAVVYAPNAAFTFHGSTELYGSVLAKTIDDTGGASIHYDNTLQSEFFIAGSPMIGTFSWKRY